VVPSDMLENQCRERMPLENTKIHTCKFEEFKTTNKYSLIIFSESFQYISYEYAMKKAASLLEADGHILICDFLKNDTDKKFSMGGRHSWGKWQSYCKNLPSNLELIIEDDITSRVSSTLDLYNDLSLNFFKPSFNLTLNFISARYPFISKILFWIMRKRIKKIENKYFEGKRNGANFEKYKKYILCLFKKS
jgi:hypothetical protein